MNSNSNLSFSDSDVDCLRIRKSDRTLFNL